jgi:hypothetical protein
VFLEKSEFKIQAFNMQSTECYGYDTQDEESQDGEYGSEFMIPSQLSGVSHEYY